MAEPQQQPSKTDKPRRKSALDEIVDRFEDLVKVIEVRAAGYSSRESALAKAFVANTKGMIARARGEGEDKED